MKPGPNFRGPRSVNLSTLLSPALAHRARWRQRLYTLTVAARHRVAGLVCAVVGHEPHPIIRPGGLYCCLRCQTIRRR